MTRYMSLDSYTESTIKDDEIRLVQLRGLYAIGNYPLLATLIISLLLAFALRDSADQARLLGWLGAIIAALTVSTIVLGRVQGDAINPDNARRLKMLHMYIIVQNGFIFGLSGYLLFDPQSVYNQTVLLVLLCGLSAGAVGVYALSFEAYLYFSTPLIAPLIVAVALSDSQLRPIMLPGLAVFYVAMAISSARTNKISIRSIVLGVENERLHEELLRQMDILKNTETILEASEKRHRTLLEQAVDGIVVLDSEGYLISANAQMYEIAGVEDETLEGMRFANLFLGSDQDDGDGFMRRVSDGQTVAEDKRIQRHDGTVAEVFIRARQLEHGIIQCIVHDITDRKRAEESLRLLDVAIRTSRLGVTYRDCGNIIRYINPAEAAMHGYSPEELMGRDISVLTGGRTCKRHTVEELTEMRSWARESTNAKKDNTRFPVYLVSDVVMDDEGEPLGVITICEDITDKKNTEMELREAHEMLRQMTTELRQTNADLSQALEVAESANASKTQFLANMSHEIRTPMNAIIGLTDILMNMDHGGEQKEYVQTIAASADSLLSIINDILDISKIEAGKLVLNQMEFDPRSVVMDAVRLLSMQTVQKGLDFVESVAENVPKKVVGDPTRIRQVLLNLLGNAVKFTDKGTIRLDLELLEAESENEIRLLFKVMDTGIGIAEDQIADIFESYTQADSSNTRRHGGTGLGLSIAKKLVETMGGNLRAESQKGQGSTFSFDVRLRGPSRAASSVQASRPGADASLKGLRVLLVEDNLINQKITQKLLARMGIEAEVEKTGEGAIARLGREAFDLVLMDVKMPGMDGHEATRIIRGMEQEHNRRVPVLALTAHAFDDSRLRCIEAGMDGFVSKPVRFQELSEAIRAAVSRKDTTRA